MLSNLVNRHADFRQALCDYLQRHRLAGAGGTGNAAVPVHQIGEHANIKCRVAMGIFGNQERFWHGSVFLKAGLRAAMQDLEGHRYDKISDSL
jgi:hypothetical protein